MYMHNNIVWPQHRTFIRFTHAVTLMVTHCPGLRVSFLRTGALTTMFVPILYATEQIGIHIHVAVYVLYMYAISQHIA